MRSARDWVYFFSMLIVVQLHVMKLGEERGMRSAVSRLVCRNCALVRGDEVEGTAFLGAAPVVAVPRGCATFDRVEKE